MSEDVFDRIKADCLASGEQDPFALLVGMMHKDYIRMHGPEHHVLDGACLLTALHNNGVTFDLAAALDELADRGRKMPGAMCGHWGVCGAAASLGAALAVVHGTGPLSTEDYYADNLCFTSVVLGKMAEIGGPRCCKRNAFLAMGTMCEFLSQRYGIALPTGAAPLKCEFTHENRQCIGDRCPFY